MGCDNRWVCGGELARVAACDACEDGQPHRDYEKGCEGESESRGQHGICLNGGGVPEPPECALFAEIFRAFECPLADALDVGFGRLDLSPFAEELAEEFGGRYGRLHFAEYEEWMSPKRPCSWRCA